MTGENRSKGEEIEGLEELSWETSLEDESPEPNLDLHKNEDAQDGLHLREALSLQAQVEAIIFASPKPLKSSEIAEIIKDLDDEVSTSAVDGVVSHLMKQYREHGGGFSLVHEPGTGYQFQTVPAASQLMEKMFSSRPRPLSRAALETLSIIAYKQPSTRAEIEYVRGVDAGSIIKNLLDRELIKCVGRKEDAGRPMLFGTTPEFLKVFKLNTLDDLPPLASFQPPSEIIKNSQIDIQDSVDVEEFVGDRDHEWSETSDGLALEDFDSEDDDGMTAEGEAKEINEESSEELPQFDFQDMEEEDHVRITNPEISLPAGDSLKEGS